ncbi:cytidine deaminase [Microlunatus endophyticus]|uniref:Cytidine deaminase n=1 Tax=Microlunatus endophyticus TaxID=1716077 RepID=A0A917W3B1_9ACTN|nr:cytidine deaminase [Microlunatus endophyticus]GGL62954.1 cytidine deaminase [Microlunatus endophyticus]
MSTEPVEHALPVENPRHLEEPTDPEDLKIITLARSALARTQASQGASVRDTDGRTYAAATVDLDHLKLSAVQVALAMAVSSGARGLEAVAVSGVGPSADDLAVIADLPGSGVVVWVTDPRGTVTGRITVDG